MWQSYCTVGKEAVAQTLSNHVKIKILNCEADQKQVALFPFYNTVSGKSRDQSDIYIP